MKVPGFRPWQTVLTAVVLAASGCVVTRAGAAPSDSTSSLSGLGPITFATGKLGTGSYVPALLREWNRTHPRQRVTLIQLPNDADDQLAQLVTNLQAGSDTYDVMSLDVVWTAEFASNRWVIPLSRSLFPLSEFLRPAVETAMYQGKLWAAPFTSNAELLYYRSDILGRVGAKPPKTWAQLAELARTIAPRFKLWGYAGQFSAYEGLTVNFDEAVESAGGSILSAEGTRVTLNSPQARDGLAFLVRGFRQGWIPRAALSFDEQASQNAFENGKLLFLNNWLYMDGGARKPGPGNVVAGKFGLAVLPGPNGPGASALGGANLAISAFSRHQRTALNFIKFLTSLPVEKQVLTHGSMPPVWTQLYHQPSLVKKFPFLPALEKAILSASPRPQTPEYYQLSLAIAGSVHRALMLKEPVSTTITQLSHELTETIKNG